MRRLPTAALGLFLLVSRSDGSGVDYARSDGSGVDYASFYKAGSTSCDGLADGDNRIAVGCCGATGGRRSLSVAHTSPSSNGSVLLTYGKRHEPFGVHGKVSHDRGRTWADTTVVLATNLPGTDIGYPSTARLSDGTLVTVYYQAGNRDQPNDAYEGRNVSCVAVRYNESELLSAAN